MNESLLFELAAAEARAHAEAAKLFHKKDPHTSKKAARKVVKKLNSKQKYVLRLLRNYCAEGHKDFTPKEVAGGINRMYFDIQRRKHELAEKLYIAKTGEERGGCEVWRLI